MNNSIFQATSSGNCVVSPNPASVVRNSPLMGKSASSSKVSSSSKNSAAAAAGESTNKLNSITSNVVTSSTLPSNDSIPKLNIKLSSIEYPQVIHNETSANECNNKTDTNRTESPLPKLTIRIPKPTEKPLEIITAGLGSPFRNTDNESQQSPRIILKINKNTTSQAKESATLTSTTIIASDDLQTRSDSPHVTAKQNELKRSNYEVSTEISAKKQKLKDTDDVHLLSSDSDYDEKDQQSTSIKHSESPEKSNESEEALTTEVKHVQEDSLETTTTTASNSFNANSGLRSILSRPQMKIQPPQTLQNFLQALPPFKGVATTIADTTPAAVASSNEDSSKLNDVIDLCHDSNDQIGGSSLNDELTTHETNEESNQMNIVNENNTKSAQSGDQNKNSNYNWQCFYNDSTKEQIQPVHPLLQQDIERANVLAAMMEAANKRDNSTNENENDNNNTAILEQTNNSSNNLLFDNEGSSSDCIVIEDTASEPFACEFARTENLSEMNGSKKECVDRDSGVDVSNSVKSIAEEDAVPTVKRPRGRPRKGSAVKTIVK